MLLDLHVKNLALIEEEEVHFGEGLNVLSGETGAGKSIILGALGIALGKKASKDMVRNPREDGLVEAVFAVRSREQRQALEALDIPIYDDQLIFSRRISQNRTVSKINGETLPAQTLRKAGEVFIDIYGQNEQQTLLKKSRHLALLDEFAAGDLDRVKRDLARAYQNYSALRKEEESFSLDERWRLRRRVEKLNEMGYDVAELAMNTDSDGNHITIQPKVVDAGHYHRQVMRLTGLDVQERQGQRMLNDLEAYRAITGRSEDPIELVAHSWLAEVFEPTIHSVPVEMRRKLEPAEIFHEILEHRWYMSEAQDRYVTTQEAVEDYVATVLPQHRDERAYLGVGDTQEMEAIVVDDDTDEPMPEDDAEFAARDEQTLADYAANPFGFTAGMKFKGE